MSTQAQLERNKQIIARITLEAFNLGRPEVLDEVVVADSYDHTPAPGMAAGVEGYKQFIPLLRLAFPDLEYTIDLQIAEGDFVVTRVTGHGTHRGPFLGIPASGQRVRWTQTHIARLADGKMVEHWADTDQLGLLQQLGALPLPQ
jgi:predicted ester cyclase